MRWKSVKFDDKAKVGALVQRARTFKKQKLAEEAKKTNGMTTRKLGHVQ
jgi:hypothetical protein